MTATSITLTGQQKKLALAIAPDKMQADIGEPFAADLCTRVLTLEDKTFAAADPTIEDIVSCDGQNLADDIIREWRGAFTCTFLGNSQDLGWACALAMGASTSAANVSASTVVFTITLDAGVDGGTFRIVFGGPKTAPIAWNADQATIQAAVDAVIGEDLLDVARTGTGPISLTGHAASAYASAIIRRPTLRTAKLRDGSDPAGAKIETTTPGGPARKSYSITCSTDDQPPATTAVLGFTNGKAWLLSDLVVDKLSAELQDSGFYRITISFIWSGLYELVEDFEWPPCSLPTKLDVKDSDVLFAGVSHVKDLKALTWEFSNNIQLIYATDSPYAEAFVRQFPLTSVWTARLQEDVTLAGSVYKLATANAQNGTKLAFTARMGDPADGATFANAETKVRLDGTAVDFGGTPSYGRTAARMKAFNSDSSASKPTSVTVITQYAGGYLAAA